jgi:hypothetical protein
MASLRDTVFPIDREGPVPAFYVLRSPQEGAGNWMGKPGEHVFAECASHPARDWATVGIVTSQTPFGQGMAFGVQRVNLRVATTAEVRRAVQRVYPVGGELYKPTARFPEEETALRNWRRICARQVSAILRSLS